MRDNGCNGKTNKQTKQICKMSSSTWVKSEKGHFALEVKIANKIICDQVWENLLPPISVTCSKLYIRKAPFVLWSQPLDLSPLSHCWPS
jgi:hypothetical protein